MSRAHKAATHTPSPTQLKIAVGDVVSWGSHKAVGIVQTIRVIETGRFVQTFHGKGAGVVLTISDGVGTAFVVAEDGAVSHVEREQTHGLLSRIRQNPW